MYILLNYVAVELQAVELQAVELQLLVTIEMLIPVHKCWEILNRLLAKDCYLIGAIPSSPVPVSPAPMCALLKLSCYSSITMCQYWDNWLIY